MKYSIFLFSFLFSFYLNAQIIRYPYIQATTTNSTIIAWKTNVAALGVVKYGIDENNLNFSENESSTNTDHGILLSNLQENTKYYYEVYSGLTLETAEFFFTAKDSTHNNFSFIHYGDCGYNTEVQYELGHLMEEDSAEFAVVCGDIDQGGIPHYIIGVGTPEEGGDNYDEIYFDIYNDGDSSKMLSRECHYTAIGNHDYYANNGAGYDSAFYLLHNNTENSERYYSFTWGDAKFICLDVISPYDTTGFPNYNNLPINDRWWTDFREGSPQYEFLVDELKCNDQKWVFVYFHEGPWTNYWGPDYNVSPALGGDYYQWDGNIMVRDELVPVFEEYQVDFVLCGHSHLYERGEWNGVTYITSGSAGDDGVANNIEYVDPHWDQLPVAILENVYAKYTVLNDSIYLEAINNEDNVVDAYSKSKNYIAFDVDITTTSVTCYGGSDGSATLNIVGPKPPYTIEWFDGDVSSTKTNLPAGTHFAYISNVNDCEKVISVTIEEPPVFIPQIVSTSGSDQFCEGESITLYTVDSASYDLYSWLNGETTALIDLTQEESITVTVINEDGCEGTSSAFSVNFLPIAVASFANANSGNTYNFLAETTNVTTYTWNFGDGTDSVTTNSLITHTFFDDGIYPVTLYASNGCNTDTFSKTIKIGEIVEYTPAIFTVINNNFLDIFPNPFSEKTTIKTNSLKGELEISLYNIKGEKIKSFKTKNKTFILRRERLVKGLYFIEILDKNNLKTVSKIIVD